MTLSKVMAIRKRAIRGRVPRTRFGHWSEPKPPARHAVGCVARCRSSADFRRD
jgi:hypothetical protein